MVKRQLTELEKKICKKQIKRIKDELEHTCFLAEHNKLMLDKGLHSNYLEKVREFKRNADILKGDIEMNHEKVRVLLEQIKNGVEKKAPLGYV